MSASTADNFIHVMGVLGAIDPSNDEPMRHQMRAVRRAAIDILDDAILRAGQLAYLAKDIQKEGATIIEEAGATTTGEAG